MKFDGIILDVDGTIWNTTSIVASAWNIAIDKNFPQLEHVNAQILQGQFGKTMKTIADNLFSPLSEDEKYVLMEKCCQEEQKALHSNTQNITYPGVVETIKILSKKIPVYIVSNCQKGYIEVVIEKNHISDFISDFECYGNNGLNKDQNISLLINRNNLKKAVYVGDTQGDYEACIKAGLPFIWASYGFGKPADENYYAKISNFSDLLDIIE
ncbi:MAG: HAD family hydrolase [Treponema sp.]|nr:HAD family hydrolase [Treponema sp.]